MLQFLRNWLTSTRDNWTRPWSIQLTCSSSGTRQLVAWVAVVNYILAVGKFSSYSLSIGRSTRVTAIDNYKMITKETFNNITLAGRRALIGDLYFINTCCFQGITPLAEKRNVFESYRQMNSSCRQITQFGFIDSLRILLINSEVILWARERQANFDGLQKIRYTFFKNSTVFTITLTS